MPVQIEIKSKRNKSFSENESYKKLRTSIQFSGKDMKVIAFTSSVPNEGKSEVSFNLACSLAEMSKKTLYLDADLRNSAFLSKYDIHKELKGLAHCLVGENTADDVIAKTQNPFLDVMSIGAFPPNPSELLSQEGYRELIAELRTKYDYVIIDTPPAGMVIDGVIASAVADGVILVLASGRTSQKAARATVGELEKASCKIIGCVLNKCGENSGNSFIYNYSDYKYGYGYMGEYGRKRRTSYIDKIKEKFAKKK